MQFIYVILELIHPCVPTDKAKQFTASLERIKVVFVDDCRSEQVITLDCSAAHTLQLGFAVTHSN
jgi:hypothetical protein